jgi:DNA-binding HxlR family transcriptional regulator
MENQVLLEKQVLNFSGNHICLIYDRDPLEQLPALIPFIKQGLERDEQVIYIADDLSVEQLSLILKMQRIDVEAESSRGALKLWTRREWRQPGELDSRKKSEQVHGFIDDALKCGFKGIRFAVEMTWTLGPDIEAEALEHWESTINTIFTASFPGRIMCQYNRHRLPASVTIQALRTHPFAVIEDCLCQNAFYEDPLAVNNKSEDSRLEWMMSRLKMLYADITRVQGEDETDYLSDKNSLSLKNNIVQVLGKKYTMFLLTLMGDNGGIRFNDIKDRLGKISSSTLSQRLDELEDAGLIKRVIYPEVPPRVQYSLSKSGAKLLKTLNPLL